MWYSAVIMLTQPRIPNRRRYFCETCRVLFNAPTANEAYRKAVRWGEAQEGMKLLGVTSLYEVGEEIGDGIEIGGNVFTKLDVWDRKSQIIPNRKELSAIRLENGKETPINQLMSQSKLRSFRQMFGSILGQRRRTRNPK